MHQQIKTPPDLWLIGVVIAAALVLLAAAVIMSVLLAAKRPIVAWERIKSALGLALWIVPAGAVVAFIATNSHDRFSNTSTNATFDRVNLPPRPIDVEYLPISTDVNEHGGGHHDGEADHLASHASSAADVRWPRAREFRLPHTREQSAGLLIWPVALVAIVAAVLSAFFATRRPFRPRNVVLVLAPWAVACALWVMGVSVRTRVDVPTDQQGEIISNAPTSVTLAPLLHPVGERLKTRLLSSDAPAWPVELPTGGHMNLVRFDSKLYASVAEAETDVTIQAIARVSDRFREDFGVQGVWAVPVALVDRLGVKDLVTEFVDKDFGEGIGKAKMYRSHLRLDYSQKLRDALLGDWRAQAVHQRILILGSILGLVTLMLGTAAVYFHLDDLTQGQYRSRLKLAAAAIVAAASLATLSVV